MAAVNGQKVQHLQYYNNYCIRVAILYLVLLRIGNYAERLFDSMETKNARTYEVFILAHLKVTTGHRIACVAGGLQRSEKKQWRGGFPSFSPAPSPWSLFCSFSDLRRLPATQARHRTDERTINLPFCCLVVNFEFSIFLSLIISA